MPNNVSIRQSITYTIGDGDREFEVEHNPDCDSVIVKAKPGGGWVVGYLSHDPEGACHPLDDCGGQGKMYDGRRGSGSQEEFRQHAIQDADKAGKSWISQSVRGRHGLAQVMTPRLAVMLDVYSHGGDVWRVHGSEQYFPDEMWDVSHGAGIWVPDGSCEDHIKIMAKCKGLPKAFQIKWDDESRIVIEVDTGEAAKYVFEWPDNFDPDKHSIFRLDNDGQGYASFVTAATAVRRLLGLPKITRRDLERYEREVAVECTEQAIDQLNKYISGDNWGVCIETFDEEFNSDEQDACWGHIGSDWAKQALQEEIDGLT